MIVINGRTQDEIKAGLKDADALNYIKLLEAMLARRDALLKTLGVGIREDA